MAKLVRAFITMLSIVAGPALVSLIDGRLPMTSYIGDVHLRGSLDDVSELQLRGSLR